MDRNKRVTSGFQSENGAVADLTRRMQNCRLRSTDEAGSGSSSNAKGFSHNNVTPAKKDVGQAASVVRTASLSVWDSPSGGAMSGVVVESVAMAAAKPHLFTDAELTPALAIDCEGVGSGPKGKLNLAARVSIVNEYGECVYDTYVKHSQPITDYRTWLTGIGPEHLENGRAFKEVHEDVKNLLKGKKVVGHALHNDFRMLKYQHPEHLIRDTSVYDPFICLAQQCHPSLKTLARLVLQITIHDGLHDSIVDARTAMQLYRKHKDVWETTEYGWPTLPIANDKAKR